MPLLRVTRVVETLHSSELDSSTDLSESHLIGAFGFEIRSIGAWDNLLQTTRPRRATMLQYPDVGLAARIIELLGENEVPFDVRKVASVILVEEAMDIVRSAGPESIVIDTTSLTKSLIYLLVLEALRQRGEVFVLHTCAEVYIPPDSELGPIVTLLEDKQYSAAFRAINKIVAGEAGPYDVRAVGEGYRDPSQPSHLAAFMPLKYDRLASLLDNVPAESITAIAPFHSTGQRSARCATADYLAQYFVQRFGGSVERLSSLDFEGAYELLTNLHRHFALDLGFNFEVTLTGAKMHAVGAAMFAWTAMPAAVYYSAPTNFDAERFTKGTGVTRFVHLRTGRLGGTPSSDR